MQKSDKELFKQMIELTIDTAKMLLDEFGGFNPFGVVFYGNGAQILMLEPECIIRDNMTANQISNGIEDKIRKIRSKVPLQIAAIISNAVSSPVEGGAVENAITGRIEQSNGPSMQLIQKYRMVSGSAILGGRRLISNEHYLLPIQSDKEQFERTVELLIDVAKMHLDDFGEFNTFGFVTYRNESDLKAKYIKLNSERIIRDNMTANQISNGIEDEIRKIRSKVPLQIAAIISNADLSPVEGGAVENAITGRIEQSNGPSMQLIQKYRMVSGSAILGEKRLISKEHHLLPKSGH